MKISAVLKIVWAHAILPRDTRDVFYLLNRVVELESGKFIAL